MTTAGLRYAPIPRDQKVLVVGVVSGNLGDALENHPRVLWWHRDELHRHRDGFPAGVGRVLVTKFVPHTYFDRYRDWERRSNPSPAEKSSTHLNANLGVHVVHGFGSTGELKRIVYESLGEHHDKHNPSPEVLAKQAAVGNRGLTAMGAAMVRAAAPVYPEQFGRPLVGAGDEATRELRAKNDPQPAKTYDSWQAFLEQHWVWDDGRSAAAQARELYPTLKELGLTKATQESFCTLAAKWVADRKTGHAQQLAKAGVAIESVLAARAPSTLEVQARQAGATDPGPIPPAPPAEERRERARPADSTAADAQALLEMLAEAKKKAQEVVAVIEMAETAIPGLVDGLAAKERRIEAAIAALRNL